MKCIYCGSEDLECHDSNPVFEVTVYWCNSCKQFFNNYYNMTK